MVRLRMYLLLLTLGPANLAGQAATHADLAILGAMPIEVQLLRTRLEGGVVRTIAGIEFAHGTLAGHPVVIPVVGVGKVNAAVTTTLLLHHFRPRRVVFTGVAGALDSTLRPGDIVLATYTAQHDLGVWRADGLANFGVRSTSDTTPNPVRFPGDTLLLRVAREVAGGARSAQSVTRTPQVREGAVLTGDVFLANDSVRRDLRRRFPEALAVEMEGAAVAQVCWQFGRVPLLVIRSISDDASAGAPAKYTEFLHHAAAMSSELLARLVAALPATGR